MSQSLRAFSDSNGDFTRAASSLGVGLLIIFKRLQERREPSRNDECFSDRQDVAWR